MKKITLAETAYVLLYLFEINRVGLFLPSEEEKLKSDHWLQNRLLLEKMHQFMDYQGDLWNFVKDIRDPFEKEFNERATVVLKKLQDDHKNFGEPFAYNLARIPEPLKVFRLAKTSHKMNPSKRQEVELSNLRMYYKYYAGGKGNQSTPRGHQELPD